jgi:hypothetical protein
VKAVTPLLPVIITPIKFIFLEVILAIERTHL